MATLAPRFSFGPIKGVQQVTFTLSRGVSPSVCQVTILPTPALDTQPHTMEWSDGIRSLRFRECVVSDVSPSIDSQGYEVWQVAIWDRRWKWKFGQVSGEFNVRGDSGQILGYSRRTPKELAKMIFEAIGEKTFNVNAMPDDIYPAVNWVAQRPDAALDELCQACNCHVTLDKTDTPTIYKDGTGNEMPRVSASSASRGFNFGSVPDYVGVLSGPARFELSFPLRPVAIEEDGSIRDLEKVSYLQDNTWRHGSFARLTKKQRLLAEDSVYKLFAITLPLDPFRKAKDEERLQYLPGTKIRVEDVTQFEFLDFRLTRHKSRRLDPVNLHGKHETFSKRDEPIIYGQFYNENEQGVDNIAEFHNVSLIDIKSIFTKSWQLDRERYLVKFGDQVYRINRNTSSTSAL